MSWTTPDRRHDGYVVAEFANGQHGSGITVSGIPPDQIIVSLEYDGVRGQGSPDIRAVVRPAADVVGWRVCCRCGGDGDDPSWRAAQLLVRVTSPELEDVAEGRIHSPDREVTRAPYRDDVRQVARAMWWRHASGATALDAIGEARRDIETAQDRLRTAVAEARAGGVSWQVIGRAAGITRQSAHARWSDGHAHESGGDVPRTTPT